MLPQEFIEGVELNDGVKHIEFIQRRGERIRKNGPSAMRRTERGHCVFLSENDHCRVYEIRPDACATYPFEFVVFDLTENGTIRMVNLHYFFRRAELLKPEFYRRGSAGYNYLIPLILANRECPGLTGQPVSFAEYIQLAQSLFEPYRQVCDLSEPSFLPRYVWHTRYTDDLEANSRSSWGQGVMTRMDANNLDRRRQV